MSYIGSKPANKPLTSSDITDSIISLPKLTDGTDGNLISYDASGNPVAVATGTDGQVLTSTGAGSPPVFEDAGGGVNTPAFEATLSSAFVFSNQTPTKVQFDTESFDTDSCYDNSTNYRFTPTIAGKYYVYTSLKQNPTGSSNLTSCNAHIYKNGVQISDFGIGVASTNVFSATGSRVVELNGSTDYVEIYVYQNTSGTPQIEGDYNRSFFGAYKIIE